MPLTGIYTDALLSSSLDVLKGWLNETPSLFLRLFTNAVSRSSSHTRQADFVEAFYAGYEAHGIRNSWSDPVKAADGLWQIQSGPWPIRANLGTFTVTILGWYIVRGPDVPVFTYFDEPIVLAPGRSGPTLLLRLTQGSQPLACDCD